MSSSVPQARGPPVTLVACSAPLPQLFQHRPSSPIRLLLSPALSIDFTALQIAKLIVNAQFPPESACGLLVSPRNSPSLDVVNPWSRTRGLRESPALDSSRGSRRRTIPGSSLELELLLISAICDVRMLTPRMILVVAVSNLQFIRSSSR
jgi:hypothetical protein